MAGNQQWVAPVQPTPAYDAAAYNTSATIADVSPLPQVNIPAGTFETGQSLRFWATGKFSNTATPTLIFTIASGGVAGVALATSPTITTITAAVNWPFEIEGIITVRSVGTSGSLLTTGRIFMPATVNTFQAAYSLNTAAVAAVTVDTTVAKTLTLGATWSASSASNTLTVQQWVVEGIGY